EGVTVATFLYYPVQIFVDSKQSIYIADTANNSVVKWEHGKQNGKIVVSTRKRCEGVFVDEHGYIYVAETDRHCIVKYGPHSSSNGTVVAGICDRNGSSLSQLSSPAGIYVTTNGTMYIADRNNHRVQKWNAHASEGVTVAGTGSSGNDLASLSYPRQVIVDQQGTLYIADSVNHRVLQWEAEYVAGKIIVGGKCVDATIN
ncbi:unnamed protein product, partial [Adineta steineri]